jgi:two-component system, sensor histidine kinase and response regulator
MSLVLVADDEPAVLEVLTEVVEDLGHQVVRAHDGKEALALARAQRPNLVVTDHMMPRLSGLELCRAMRGDQVLRDVPVILLSAALPTDTSGANACLAKPFELEEFETMVRRALEEARVEDLPIAALQAVFEPLPAPGPRPPEELLRWLAHQLKTPLAAAKAHVQLLDRRLKDRVRPDERAQFAQVAHQLDGLDALIEAALGVGSLAEPRGLKFARADLGRLVKTAAGSFRKQHPEQPVALAVPAAPVFAQVDAPRLRQLLHLLFSAAGVGPGPLELRLEGGDRLCLEVSSPSYASASPSAASALGVSIAGELARLHGGALTVEQNGRTRYVLTLPKAT